MVYTTKKEAISAIKDSKGWAIVDVSDELKNDFDVVRAAVIKNPRTFEHAGPKAKANKELALLAIKKSKYGWPIKYVSDELKNDFDVVRAAVIKNPNAFEYAGPKARANKELALLAIKESEYGWPIKYVSDELKNDFDVVSAAVIKNPNTFEHAGPKAKANKELALLAIKESKYGWPIKYVSDELKNDFDVVSAAVIKNPNTFKYAGPKAKANMEIALYAITFINDGKLEVRHNYREILESAGVEENLQEKINKMDNKTIIKWLRNYKLGRKMNESKGEERFNFLHAMERDKLGKKFNFNKNSMMKVRIKDGKRHQASTID